MTGKVDYGFISGCEECGAGNRGECEEHGELFKVKDRVIPSRARLTLPHLLGVKLLELRAGGKHGKLVFYYLRLLYICAC